MRIHVEIAFSFKREMESSYRLIVLPEASTVLDALRALADQYATFRLHVFDDRERVHRHIQALVNGVHVQAQEGFRTRLRRGDRLTILPPVGGG